MLERYSFLRRNGHPMPLSSLSLLSFVSITLLLPLVTAQLSTVTPTTTVPSSTFFTLVSPSPSGDGLKNSSTASSSNVFSAAASNTAFRSVPTDVPGDDDDPPDKQTSLLNYYFVFLALFLALLFVLLYALHRRRKLKKARSRDSGQNALARDVDGWVPSGRRWVAARLDRHNRFGTRALEREDRDLGLNEFGEAPPPYKVREAELAALGAASAESSRDGPAVPLRTLSRGAVGKPPGYEEAVTGVEDGTTAAAAAAAAAAENTSPDTTAVIPDSTAESTTAPTHAIEHTQPPAQER
jgi:hypothetical protein